MAASNSVARDAHLGDEIGERDRNRRLAVERERFLRTGALHAELGERAPHGGVGRVDLAQVLVDRRVHVREHGVVEVEAAEALEALGRAQQLTGAVAAAHDGDVEGAAAEVVDRDGVARVHATEVQVVQRRGFGFAEQRDALDAGNTTRFAQQVELELAPVRGVGQHDGVGPVAVAVGGDVEYVTEQLPHERVGAVRGAADHERSGVAEPALGLAGSGRRLGQQPPFGGVARDHRVAVERDDRRHGGAVLAECERFGLAARRAARRRGPGGAEIDAQSGAGVFMTRGYDRSSDVSPGMFPVVDPGVS